MKGDKVALDCCRQLLLCIRVRWHGDLVRDWSGHWTSPERPSPLPDVQLFSQVSLLEARREELHQG